VCVPDREPAGRGCYRPSGFWSSGVLGGSGGRSETERRGGNARGTAAS
jgi:hypothetical protein